MCQRKIALPPTTSYPLKEMFSLSIKEAVAAIRRANSIRYGIQPYYGGGDASAYGNTRGANQNDHSQFVVYENGAAFGTAISPVALQVDWLRRGFPLSSQFARVVALHCLGGRNDGAIPRSC